MIPLILSDGSGTRLRPPSPEAYSKQLLPLAGTDSMLPGEDDIVRFEDVHGRG